jgi:OOP family OmpA-OmpF porin
MRQTELRIMSRMRIRTENNISNKMRLRAKHRIIIAASFCAALIVFVFAFFAANIGFQSPSKAGDISSRYPFEISAGSLKKVNFTALPLQINSNFEEVRPLVSANGRKLFFSRRNHPENINGSKDEQDIWVSTMNAAGEWDKPENLGLKINTKKADALCSVAPDGSEIYLFSETMHPERFLFKSKKTPSGWSDPEAVTIDDFYMNDAFIDVYYSYYANVLLLAVSRDDSKGEQDIYVCFSRGANKFSKPQSLGITVNSEKSDFAPFLASDGKTLYFSSYGHDGFGGCDIFRTTRTDDTWKHWTRPENLGEGVNSSREESYFSIDGNYQHIYFESYSLEKEVRDIFRADLPENYKPGAIDIESLAKK